MKRLALVLLFAGCATMRPLVPQAPEVARLQDFADSIQPGWRVESGWAQQGYLASMVEMNPGYPMWMRWQRPTIYVRDEVVGTKCADVLIAAMFARRLSGIPFNFAPKHVSKETREILVARGWTEAEIAAAAQSCPSSIAAR